MRGKMANSARRIAALKIGSTSVAALGADRLSHPDAYRVWLLGLVDAPSLRDRLAPVLAEVAAWLPRQALVGIGEVGRLRPELADWLARWGWPVWQLSGTEEAQCTWWGVQAGRHRPAVVVDVGGASTELCDGCTAASWPFGAARPPQRGTRLDAPWAPGARELVAVGGTAVALAAMAGSPRLERPALVGWSQRPREVARCAADQGVDPARAALLPGGIRSLLHVMDSLGAPALEVSERGLVHGLWLAARLGRVPHAR